MANISKNAKKVLEKRYFLRNKEGEVIETLEDLFRRVTKAVTQNEKEIQDLVNLNKGAEKSESSGCARCNKKHYEEEFFNLLNNLEFLPNSPTLMNAGKPDGQLSACFVLPIEDSMNGIFDAIKNAALIHKSGGGTGFSFSKLRQSGSTVKSTNGVASGPVSFMKVFDSATEAVKQGGTRRGANMGILRVDHPDILEFIKCKSDNTVVNNFNISIAITSKFIKALENSTTYNLIDPKTNEAVNSLSAKEVWDLIIEMSWKNGEPGILFIDRVNEFNPTPSLGEIESTNPCGEQVLLPYESCNLGSINLTKIVKDKKIDYNKLRHIVRLSVRFLDNVIDVNNYPLPEIEDITKKVRKIGLGVMGFADMLFLLGIPYNSLEAIHTADSIMKVINETSKEASSELAIEKGVFPEYDKSIFYDKSPNYKKPKIDISSDALLLNAPLRNATTTTIAPTGTISMIAGVSSGIEPLFALSYIRNIMDGEEMIEVNPIFERVLRERNLYSEELLKEIAKKGSIQDIKEIPDDIKRVFVTAHDIAPKHHVLMQATFQKHTDNAVSKTVNLPHTATKKEINDIITFAYNKGCKGITVYRDGSREMQVLNIGEVKGKKDSNPNSNKANDKNRDAQDLEEDKKIIPKERPEVLSGSTERFKTACGNIYITINGDEKGFCEVFTNTGKAGGCPSQSEAISRLVSIALRAGVDEKYLIEQLKGIRCPAVIRINNKKKEIKGLSCPDIIGRMIEKMMEEREKKNIHSCSEDAKKKKLDDEIKVDGFIGVADESEDTSEYLTDVHQEERNEVNRVDFNLMKQKFREKCPDCSESVEADGGCRICKNCGWSKCS